MFEFTAGLLEEESKKCLLVSFDFEIPNIDIIPTVFCHSRLISQLDFTVTPMCISLYKSVSCPFRFLNSHCYCLAYE